MGVAGGAPCAMIGRMKRKVVIENMIFVMLIVVMFWDSSFYDVIPNLFRNLFEVDPETSSG
jgi:hypothetical protein